MVSNFMGRESTKFDLLMAAVIIINIISAIVETVDSLYIKYHIIFNTIESVSIVLFTIEYLYQFTKAKHKLKYLYSFTSIIDIISIVPFYLPMFISIDLRIIRSIKLFRLFRLLKINKYVITLKTLYNVLYDAKEKLLITLFSSSLLIVIFSTLMFFVENKAQPDKFSSIPSTMWWCVITLTTVGYGDMYPITDLGRLLGGVISVLGIGMIALPAGIISSGFSNKIDNNQRVEREKQKLYYELSKKGVDNTLLREIFFK